MWQDNFTECPIFQSTLAYLIYYNDEIHLVVSAMDKRVYYGDLNTLCWGSCAKVTPESTCMGGALRNNVFAIIINHCDFISWPWKIWNFLSYHCLPWLPTYLPTHQHTHLQDFYDSNAFRIRLWVALRRQDVVHLEQQERGQLESNCKLLMPLNCILLNTNQE